MRFLLSSRMKKLNDPYRLSKKPVINMKIKIIITIFIFVRLRPSCSIFVQYTIIIFYINLKNALSKYFLYFVYSIIFSSKLIIIIFALPVFY